MPTLPESWLQIAQTLGYPSEREMLRDLYSKHRLSVTELAEILGFSRTNVRRRLVYNFIVPRGRGGDNRSGRTRLRTVPDEELRGPATKLAEKYGVHVATVFLERKRRGICGLPLSRRSASSNVTQPEAQPTSSSPNILEILDTLHSIEDEERPET